MKVLFLAPANSIHTVRWVNSLSKKNVDIVLVSLKNHYDFKKLIRKEVKVHYLPIVGLKGYYLNQLFLKKIIKREKIDILNVHYASGYGTLSRLSRFHPTLLSVWGSDIYTFPFKSKFNNFVVRKNLDSSDYIGSTSCCMAEEAMKLMNKEKHIFITPFGIDTDLFQKKEVQRSFGVFKFGTVKTLDDIYGIDFLIECFAKFINKYGKKKKDVEFVYEIYGVGPKKEDYQNLIKELQMENYIKLCGYVDNAELPKVLNSFDIFLLGSRQESFGVAALEAMSCQLPIISTDAPGLKEIITDKENGRIIIDFNIDDFVYTMNELFANHNIRESYGIEARKTVLKLYKWDNNVQNMLSIYKQITRE